MGPTDVTTPLCGRPSTLSLQKTNHQRKKQFSLLTVSRIIIGAELRPSVACLCSFKTPPRCLQRYSFKIKNNKLSIMLFENVASNYGATASILAVLYMRTTYDTRTCASMPRCPPRLCKVHSGFWVFTVSSLSPKIQKNASSMHSHKPRCTRRARQ